MGYLVFKSVVRVIVKVYSVYSSVLCNYLMCFEYKHWIYSVEFRQKFQVTWPENERWLARISWRHSRYSNTKAEGTRTSNRFHRAGTASPSFPPSQDSSRIFEKQIFPDYSRKDKTVTQGTQNIYTSSSVLHLHVIGINTSK